MCSADREAAKPPCTPPPLEPEPPGSVAPLPPPAGAAGMRGSVGAADAGAPTAPVLVKAAGEERAPPLSAAAAPAPVAAARSELDAACGPEANLSGEPAAGVPLALEMADGAPAADVSDCVTTDAVEATVRVTGASTWPAAAATGLATWTTGPST